ncbi:MAG: nucleotidyl transferase AbiEii/AbiGii toxin family protein [Candidatus Omnitrophica bacterium]|nr:nucleotidyl transferase AbiEii/AbiGii toxin family protein [Candidatus Omnitrophota bacterium]
MGARGYQRVTLDVDFMITETDYEKIKPLILAMGYIEVARTPVAAKLRAETKGLLDIDFIFVEIETFQAIQKECKIEIFQDAEFLVPKPEYLIALKLHAIKQQPTIRELKDLNDIVELIKANGINISSESFKSLCLKFGTPDLKFPTFDKLLPPPKKVSIEAYLAFIVWNLSNMDPEELKRQLARRPLPAGKRFTL